MNPEDLENKTDATPASDEGKTPAAAPSQTHVEAELEREQKKGGVKTEAEKATFALKNNADRARQLGLNPEEILGIKPKEITPEDESKPMTFADYQRLEAEKAAKTAEQMADEIPDEKERELTKIYLKRVVPSGNAAEDLRFARSAVNSVKNGMIVEEIGRKGVASSGTGSGGPGRKPDAEFVPTASEADFMAKFGLSKEQILKAREQQ